jgi:uncharacterized protein YbaP (TraB family)
MLRFFSLFFALLWAACGHGQATVATHGEGPRATSTPASTPGTPGLFLYEISGQNGPSYVLGTIHIGFSFEEVLTESARQAFAQSRRVWMEADVSSANPQELIGAALLPQDQSLHRILGDAMWADLVQALGQQIPPPMLDRLKPWLPALVLGLGHLEQALDQVKPGGRAKRMDLELMEQAQKAGKQLHFFETLDEQMAVFESIPEAEQLKELSHSLSDGGNEEGRAMLQAFANGDEVALEHALFAEMQRDESPGFYTALLDSRNARWLPLVDQEVATGAAFIAVGAAHLYGDKGLLSELKKRGHAVKRVGN